MAMLHIGSFTSNELTPEGDEYVTVDIDEAGEQKVTPDGHLLGGREYIIHTFLLPNRGNKLFMLATESAKELNYRDSYLLFNKNKNLYKLIASQHDKETLIQSGLLPFSFRSRQIAVVSARSMFCQFGSRIIRNGKRVRDDYWEGKAIEQGFTENDPVITDRRSLTAHNLQVQQNNPNSSFGFSPFKQQQPQFQVSAQYGVPGGSTGSFHMAGANNNNAFHHSGGPGGNGGLQRPQGSPGSPLNMRGGGGGGGASSSSGSRQLNSSSSAAHSSSPSSASASSGAMANAPPNPQAAYHNYLQNLSTVNYYANPNNIPRDPRFDYPDEQATASLLSSLMSSGNSSFFIPGSDISGSFDYQDAGPINHHQHRIAEDEATKLCVAFNRSLSDSRASRIQEWSSFWINKYDDNQDILNEEKESIIAAINGEAETDKEPITELKIPMLNKPVKGELEQIEPPPVYIPEPPLVQKVRNDPSPNGMMPHNQQQHQQQQQLGPHGVQLGPQLGSNKNGPPQYNGRQPPQPNMNMGQMRMASGTASSNPSNGNMNFQGRMLGGSMSQQMHYANNADNMSPNLQQQPNQSLNWRGQPAPWNNYHG